MGILGGLEAAAAAIGLVSDLKDFAGRSNDDRRRVRPILTALRGIYFTPRGTQRILGVLAQGGRPDLDDVQEVLGDFNDAEWQVERHLRMLDFDRSLSSDISLRHRRELEMLSYGKRTLRREIQDLLNDTVGRGEGLEQDRAADLLYQIERLNGLIEQIEEQLL
jgi:hypothetical protein